MIFNEVKLFKLDIYLNNISLPLKCDLRFLFLNIDCSGNSITRFRKAEKTKKKEQ